MSMKDFVATNCGTTNPILNAASHLTQNQVPYRNPATFQPGQTSDDFVQEFLQTQHAQPVLQPQTFNMGQLLNEINETESSPPNMVMQRTNNLDMVMQRSNIQNAWANDFQAQLSQQSPFQHQHHHHRHDQHQHEQAWVQDFNRGNQMMQPQHSSWKQDFHRENMLQSNQWDKEFHEQNNYKRSFEDSPAEALEAAWNEEEVKSLQRSSNQTDEFGAIAAGIVDSVKQDPKMLHTDFITFLKEHTGEKDTVVAKALISNLTSRDTGNDWVDSFEEYKKTQQLDSKPWAEEFVSNSQRQDPFLDRLEASFRSGTDESSASWVDDFEEYVDNVEKEYKFTEENPFKELPDTFAEGLKRIKLGDLANAVLLFEAAVQRDSSHVEAWFHLGQAQQQNEQEEHSISAFRKTLELEPENLPARMGLAVGLTNESMLHEAINTLKDWLHHSPKYHHLTTASLTQKPKVFEHSFPSAMASSEYFKAAESAFFQAARLSPSDIDADVQCALGILYHIVNDYDKAVDCFQTAIAVRPDDALLWNKLGATLANGNKNEQAVEAYRRALELNPGFTRTRYNLGISCVSLGAKREGIQHFLTALDAQRSARGPTGEVGKMSESVWDTLRMTLVMSDDRKSADVATRRDLDTLMDTYMVPKISSK